MDAAEPSPEAQRAEQERELLARKTDADNFSKAMLLSYVPYFEFLKINMKASESDFYSICQNTLLGSLPPEYVKTLTISVQGICKNISTLDNIKLKKMINEVREKNKDAYEEVFEIYLEEMQSIAKKFALTQALVDKCLKEKKRIFLEGRVGQEACFADKKLQKALKKYQIAHKETKKRIRSVHYSMLLSFMGLEAVQKMKQEGEYITFYNYFIGELSNIFMLTPPLEVEKSKKT